MALGVSPQDYAAVFRDTWRERFRGEFGDVGETIRTLAMRVGGSPGDAAVRFAEVVRLRFTRKLVWPTADTLSVLDALRQQGLRLGLLSNCSAETAAVWPKQPMAQRFHAVGLSCDAGMMKPDPAFYLKVCGDLGVDPGECVYVGDGAGGELPAAAALGMRVFRTTQFADTEPGWSGETISHLRELTGLTRA